MLELRKFVVISALFLGGCAGTFQGSDEEQVQEVSVDKVVRKQPEVDMETAIDPDVLYYLMTAEVAGQRGQYDVALEGYMRAAREVDDPRIAERAAKIALYLKDSEKTEEAVELWLDQDSDSLVARKIAVMSAIQNEDKVTAVEHLSFLLKADTAGFEKTLLELVKVAEADGKGAFVVTVLDEMVVRHPQQAELYFVQGVLAAQLQDKDLALEKVQQALNLQPGWTKALIFQAQLAAQSGDLQQAEEILRKVVKEEPDNTQIKKLLAQILIKNKKYQAAADVYQEILDQQPDDAESKYALALVYLQVKQNDKAKKLLEQLLDVPGWQDQASLYIGRIEAGDKNVDAALVWFDRVKTGPLAFEAAVNAVAALITAKQFTHADRRLTDLKGDFPEKQLRLDLLQAELYSSQNEYQKAFDVLTLALQKKPEQRDLLYTRAMVAEKLDKFEVLESDLQLLIQQNPKDTNALNALGYILADRTDRYEEAEGYLNKAIKLEPDETVIIDSYGWLLFKQGEIQQALEYLQRAYAQEQEGEIAAHLIEVLWVSGQKGDARNLMKEALTTVEDKEPLYKLSERIPGLK